MSDTKERFFSSQFEAIVTELSRLASDCDIDVEQDEFRLLAKRRFDSLAASARRDHVTAAGLHEHHRGGVHHHVVVFDDQDFG